MVIINGQACDRETNHYENKMSGEWSVVFYINALTPQTTNEPVKC